MTNNVIYIFLLQLLMFACSNVVLEADPVINNLNSSKNSNANIINNSENVTSSNNIDEVINNTDNPIIEIDSPIAIAKAKLQNSEDSFSGSIISTSLNFIEFDGSGSYSFENSPIVSYKWTIIQKPLQSTTEFIGSLIDENDLKYSSSIKPLLYLDLLGDYKILLNVTDAEGRKSHNEAIVNIEAAVCCTDGLYIQLVWDHPNADLDLHLVQADSELWNSETDCYFDNKNPEWGQTGNRDNPLMDIDDVSGYGPENIRIAVPSPGKYNIFTHYFSANTFNQENEELKAFLSIYIKGAKIKEYTKVFTLKKQLWHAAVIVWPDNLEEQPLIEDIDILTPDSDNPNLEF